MNTPTEKLIRVPADTWRLVVEALEEQDIRDQHDGVHPTQSCVRAALELARKVQP